MNLDDARVFAELDPQGMLAEIDNLPQQLWEAWELGRQYTLTQFPDLRQILVAGMGGSAIGADLLAAYVAPLARVPIYVHRDYDLPAWAYGPGTLVIASSHSGNTEETLSAFEAAGKRDCLRLAITTGGRLAELAQQGDVPVWRFSHAGQPRAAVGFSFGLLLAALNALNLIPDSASTLRDTVAAMRRQQEQLLPHVPAASNPAKRQAGQLVDRWVTVFGAGHLAPVARRWKGQISEVAKAWAQFEYLPEADHNTLAGIVNPETALSRSVSLFLQSDSDHPRNRLRSELTRKVFMLEGLSVDFFDAPGATELAQMWTAL
ncbi:MAG TPA: SIS domain-containing protein, partial [Anaerolineales bacterium]|nr:SIS domain-containing protein [Anaerolineales bacterium]